MGHYLGVMSNYMGGVEDLLRGLLAVGGDDVLALLNVGCINNGLAYLARNLARVLLGGLMALSGVLIMTSRTCRNPVSRLSISICLSISLSISLTLSKSIPKVSMSHNLRVMSHNSGRVMNLLRSFLTVSGDDVLTILNISGVFYNIIFLVANIVGALLRDFMALSGIIVMAPRTSRVAMARLSISFTLYRCEGTVHKSGGQKEN